MLAFRGDKRWQGIRFSIAVTSRPGRGSSFSMTLPALVEHHLSSVPEPAVATKV